MTPNFSSIFVVMRACTWVSVEHAITMSYPAQAKRTITEQITDSITIGGDEIHIKFSYNPSLLGIDPDS